jgi:hypothetical protein
MEYMAGEKQAIRTAELFGSKWKIKIDSLLPDKIVDLKIMRSLERIMGVSFIQYWSYDLQMAVYAAVEAGGDHSGGKERKGTYLAVATKEDVPNLEIVHIPEWRRAECLDYVARELPHILEVKAGRVMPERCGVCDYCKATKILSGPVDFEDVGFSNYELKRMKGDY